MENLNVKIVSLNSKYIHSSLSPWCLMAGISAFCENDVRCEIIESTINEQEDITLHRITETPSDVFAFCTYIWNVKRVLWLSEKIKEKFPQSKILLGGPEVSYRAGSVLRDYPFIDFVISGEGEKPIAKFCDIYISGGDFSEVEGLSFRAEPTIIEGEPFLDFSDPPSPYNDEYFSRLKGRIAYLEASRGCPFRCAFCLSGRCGGVRYFELERVKRDILSLWNSGTKTVKFVDRTFNANTLRANEILTFILENLDKNPEDVCFHFEIAGDILKDSTISLLEKFPEGRVQLEIGMQSFNEKTLAKINRKTDTEKLIKNINKLLSFHRQHIHIDLIAGLTGEDIESFKRSFIIGYCLGADMLQMGFLKLLYGADMREKREEYPCSFSKDPPYEVLETPWLSSIEIKGLKNMEDVLERLYNSGRFRNTLEYLTDEVGLNPFSLFWDFGNSMNYSGMSLMEFINKVYEYFSKLENVDKTKLRDKLITDRLTTDSSANVPEVLKVPDKRLKRIKKRLSQKGRKIGAAILYSEEKVIVADYSRRCKITGQYEYKKHNMSYFEES